MSKVMQEKTFMSDAERDVKKKLIEIQNSIKKKAANIKLATVERDEALEKFYKPIVEPLHDISSNLKRDRIENETQRTTTSTVDQIKREKKWKFVKRSRKDDEKQRKSKSISAAASATAPSVNLASSEEFEYTPSDDDDDDDDENVFYDASAVAGTAADTPSQILRNRRVSEAFLNQYDNVPKFYLERILQLNISKYALTKDGFDTSNLALRYNFREDKWYIGDSECKIRGKQLTVKGTTYPGTVGLYELLLRQAPIDYTVNDESFYLDILQKSNALRRNFDPSQQMHGSRAWKYQQIIKPLLLSSEQQQQRRQPTTSAPHHHQHHRLRTRSDASVLKSGRGFFDASMIVDRKPFSYVYWDDVNELVDRLALLCASKAAGNLTAHDNEIASIVEELREAKYIY